MRILVLVLLLLATLAVAPTASADDTCSAKHQVTAPTDHEVRVYRGDCLGVTYDHPTWRCSGHVDGPIYSGTVLCNGRLVVL